jgi:hypothetical protein
MHRPGLSGSGLYDSRMRLIAGSTGPRCSTLGGRAGPVVGAADYLVAEHDGDLSFWGTALDRLEPRLTRSLGVEPADVVLEPDHEKEQAKNGKGPRYEDHQQEYLIRSHIRKCRRR